MSLKYTEKAKYTKVVGTETIKGIVIDKYSNNKRQKMHTQDLIDAFEALENTGVHVLYARVLTDIGWRTRNIFTKEAIEEYLTGYVQDITEFETMYQMLFYIKV